MYKFLGKDMELYSLTRFDKFQRNKINWLKDNEKYSDATKRTYWVLINNNVHEIEKKKDKDLCDFNEQEVSEILKVLETNNIKTRTILSSIISNYNSWAIKNGISLKKNLCDSIDISKILCNFKPISVIRYKTLDEFFEMVEGLKCSDIDKMILVLGRYNIVGKHGSNLLNLKWTDIDKDNMIVNIGNDIKVPIDERFLIYLEKAYRCESYGYQTTVLRYVDYGYVIKVSDKSESQTVKYNTLSTRMNSLFKNNNMIRISFAEMSTWRKFDFLLEILRKKGEVTYDDIKSVVIMLDGKNTMSRAQYLKERFIILKESRKDLI
ncbi:hypothetical protein FDF86_06280 [Clostridium botulinum]|nr:hypothetical protein [Clostridium botulinum]